MLFSGGKMLTETMPQTVPSAGSSPEPNYCLSCENFDLSLLEESKVPSPSNLHPSLLYDTSSPLMFHSPQHDGSSLHELKPMKGIKEEIGSPNHYIKYHPTPSPSEYRPTPSPAEYQTTTSPSGLSSPGSPFVATSPLGVKIKSEFLESSINLQDILHESQLLQDTVSRDNQREVLRQEASVSPSPSPVLTCSPANTLQQNTHKSHTSCPEDHRILKECLRDTSFQKKYNLKLYDFGVTTGFTSTAHIKQEETTIPCQEQALSRDKLEPVLSMAMEQVKQEIDLTCEVLGISPDPAHWSVNDVRAWLEWTLQQYNLPMIQLDHFSMDGMALSALTEQNFRQRAPQNGDILHAQLEIWKTACNHTLSSNNFFHPENSMLDISTLLQWMTGEGTPPAATTNVVNGADIGPELAPNSGDFPGENSDEEEEDCEKTSGGGRSGSSHIHLWQFLKELLSEPQLYGSCIRWLERQKGVFKIEDSVRVARLWGKRKNRPAMNYDKLSRSIRQYYKKGIMKKTERSQRLVYQFCHPYCL